MATFQQVWTIRLNECPDIQDEPEDPQESTVTGSFRTMPWGKKTEERFSLFLKDREDLLLQIRIFGQNDISVWSRIPSMVHIDRAKKEIWVDLDCTVKETQAGILVTARPDSDSETFEFTMPR